MSDGGFGESEIPDPMPDDLVAEPPIDDENDEGDHGESMEGPAPTG